MPKNNAMALVHENGEAKAVICKKSKIMRKQAVWGAAFLAPTLILFAIFTFVPVCMSFFIAVTNFNGRNFSQLEFVGLQHFAWIIDNKIFLNSILNIFIYVLMYTPQTIILSLLIANLLNSKMKGIKIFRVLFYLPAVTSAIAIAFVWKYMFNQGYGVFNSILPDFIVKYVGEWTETYSYFSLFAITMITVWTSIGGNMLVFLAGLQGISPELYEAAEIDGANSFQKLTKITVPMLAPTTFFVLTMSLIGAFQLFDVVQMIGDAHKFTQTPVMMIYAAFNKMEHGRASAESIILFVVIMITTFITQAIMKEDRK